MARTINGNHTGRAAHRTIDDEMDQLERSDQDVRIGRKKEELRKLMGPEQFKEFYVLTSFGSDALEKELDDMLNLCRAEARGVDVDGFLLLMAACDTPSDSLEFTDDWAADPEWVKSLDEPNQQQRREEWQDFLSRMNAPEMVARRGTELTPYGWREPNNS